MNPILLAVAVPAATVVVGVILGAIVQRRIEGPDALIVVVDRRTYRGATRRIQRARDAGDEMRAYAGIVAVCQWLRGEIRSGPQRHRVRYAADLEQWELRAEQTRPAALRP